MTKAPGEAKVFAAALFFIASFTAFSKETEPAYAKPPDWGGLFDLGAVFDYEDAQTGWTASVSPPVS
ncbi:MAG: hypothetical protein LBC53_10555 [Spirochaetaceae bacterium]|nr:hypothetical protein [Spirochaetaceae bacterium]